MLNDRFFTLQLYIHAGYFIAYFMLSVKLPENQCICSMVIYTFVTVRIFLLIFLVYFTFELYKFMFITAEFVYNDNITLPIEGNKINLIISDCIVGFCLIVVIAHLFLIIMIPIAICR